MRARAAWFRLIELHAAHGYLYSSFLSQLAKKRKDRYGGSFENRSRFLLRVTEDLRATIPAGMPLFFRLSYFDWVEMGWNIEDSNRLSTQLKELRVDLIDCSSGTLSLGMMIEA